MVVGKGTLARLGLMSEQRMFGKEKKQPEDLGPMGPKPGEPGKSEGPGRSGGSVSPSC